MDGKHEALKIENLDFGYDSNLLFNNFNLMGYTGEKIAIIGSNGSGKSTLFAILAGILKPQKGSVHIIKSKVLYRKFNPNIGILFQRSEEQLFCSTVKEDIGFGPRNMKLDKVEIDKRVESSMSSLNIGHLANDTPHELSGGEKTLVALAGMISMNPHVLIFDEPTANLDIRNRRTVINLINTIDHKLQLITSHDLEFILETCNRMIILNKGTIIDDGCPKDLLSNKKLMEDNDLEVPLSLR